MLLKQQKQNELNRKLIALAFVVSLFAHLSFLPVEFKNVIRTVVSDKKKEQKIRIRFAPQSKESKRQIVTTTNTNEMPVENAKHLSEKNNKVLKETKSRVVDSFKVAGYGNNKVVNQKEQVATESKTKRTASKKTEVIKDSDKKISFKDLSFASNKKVRKQSRLIKGVKSGIRGKTGIASNNDYLEEVPLGDMTRLNTQEFKYYGFYFRIKQQLEQYWGSSIREKITKVYKRDGRFPASDKFLTSVQVVLNGKGQIVDVIIKGSSGVSELDEAAIESFNRAGPFPNPPKGMLVNDRASIEWGFAVTNS